MRGNWRFLQAFRGVATPIAFRGFFTRHPLLIPLAISLMAGVVYAGTLPPWDLIDEEQHVHYIQYVAEQHQLPEMGKTYLSREVVASLLAVDRWGKMRMAHPAGDDPRTWGLEGLSYEAYQPPLFYLSLSVPYALLPEPMLTKLYGLRALVVLLGTLSVVGVFATVRVVWPQEKSLAVAAASLLAIIPERAMVISRVNNDELAELLSVSALLLLALSLKWGLTTKLSIGIGVAVGLALLSKINAVAVLPAVLAVWIASYRGLGLRQWIARGGIIAAAVVAISGWFFYRNMTVYGDLTGVAGFLQLTSFSPDASMPVIFGEISRGFWGLWWWNRPLYLFGVLASTVFCAACVGIVLSWRRQQFSHQQKVMLLALALMLICAIAGVWAGTARGWVPSTQGRFMLPAYGAAAVLATLGLFKLAPARMRAALVGVVVVAVLGLNGYVLLYLLPYHYPFP